MQLMLEAASNLTRKSTQLLS